MLKFSFRTHTAQETQRQLIKSVQHPQKQTGNVSDLTETEVISAAATCKREKKKANGLVRVWQVKSACVLLVGQSPLCINYIYLERFL